MLAALARQARAGDGARRATSALIDDLLRLMARDHADFTITFRRLGRLSSAPAPATTRCATCSSTARPSTPGRCAMPSGCAPKTSIDAERALRMNAVNPKYVLRNHLAETAIERARARRLQRGAAAAESSAAPVRRTTRTRSRCRLSARLGRPTRSVLFFMNRPRTRTTTRATPVHKTDERWRAQLDADAVPGGAPRRHRARLQRQVLGPLRQRPVPLRRLRHAAVREPAPSSTPAAAGPATGSRSTAKSSSACVDTQPRHGARRSPLQQLRQPPRPRLRRRARADRRALLHQFGGDRLQAANDHARARSRACCARRWRRRRWRCRTTATCTPATPAPARAGTSACS